MDLLRHDSWAATYVYLHSTTATTATARSAEENFGASRAAAGVDAVVSQLGRGGRPSVSLRSVENHLGRCGRLVGRQPPWESPPGPLPTPERCSGGTPPCTTPAYELHHSRSGAVLRGHAPVHHPAYELHHSRSGAVLRGRAPVHASSYDSARERCSGGTPPCTPPHMTAHASSYEMHTPARFSSELTR